MATRIIGFTIGFVAILAQAQPTAADEAAYVIEPPDVVKVEAFGVTAAAKSIEGKHAVQPDGTISLGPYGTVYVTGMTVTQARTAIAKLLAPHAQVHGEVGVHVEISARNSKVYYMVVAAKDGDRVYRFPLAENDTAVRAVLQVEGIAAMATKAGVWIARPTGEILHVDWPAVTQEGRLATNYNVRAGDRIYVGNSPPK